MKALILVFIFAFLWRVFFHGDTSLGNAALHAILMVVAAYAVIIILAVLGASIALLSPAV